MSPLAAAVVLSWLAILALALAMTGLLRQLRALHLLSMRGPVGRSMGLRALPIHGAVLTAGSGSLDELADLVQDTGAIVVFMEENCRSCEMLYDAVVDRLVGMHHDLSRVIAFAGQALARPSKDSVADRGILVLEHQGPVFSRLQVPMTPFLACFSRTGALIVAEPVGSVDLLATVLDSIPADVEVR